MGPTPGPDRVLVFYWDLNSQASVCPLSTLLSAFLSPKFYLQPSRAFLPQTSKLFQISTYSFQKQVPNACEPHGQVYHSIDPTPGTDFLSRFLFLLPWQRENGFVWAYGLRNLVARRQLVMLHPQSESRKWWTLTFSSFFPFYTGQDPLPREWCYP